MTGATCSVHLEVPAERTCARCGRFACVACLASTDTCDACRALERSKLFNLRPFAVTAATLVLVSSATTLLDALGAELWSVSQVKELVVLGSCVLMLAAAVALPAWFYVAMQHSQVRRTTLSVDSPGLGVLTWFVPILGMVEPFTLLRQMAVSAGTPRKMVINAWQIFYIAAQVLAFASLAPSAHQAFIAQLSRSCWMIAGGLGASTVLQLKWKS